MQPLVFKLLVEMRCGYNQVLVYCCFIFLSACTVQDEKGEATYTVSSKNFENIVVISGFAEPIRATNMLCPGDIDGVITFLIEDGTYVEQGDVVCIIEYKELQDYYDQLVINLENVKAHLNKTRADLDMQYALLEAQVKNNDADTQIAELDSLQLMYSTPSQRKISELELEKVAINKARYEKKLQALAIIHQSEIRRIELEIQNLDNRAKGIKDRLDALTLKANEKGLAVRATNRVTDTKFQEGDPVWGNMQVVTIPELAEMKVKIFASERDYKVINVDDSVSYAFDAMPDNIGWGKILMKSPVGQQYKEGSKVKFFEIEASIDSIFTMPEPGFTADCSIFIHQIKDTIVAPQVAIFEQDSMKVVYVKKENGYEMRQVLTGLSSPKEAIITAGLDPGETIALTIPKSSGIKNKQLLPDSIWKKQEN